MLCALSGLRRALRTNHVNDDDDNQHDDDEADDQTDEEPGTVSVHVDTDKARPS